MAPFPCSENINKPQAKEIAEEILIALILFLITLAIYILTNPNGFAL